MANPITFGVNQLSGLQVSLLNNVFPGMPAADPLIQTVDQAFEGLYDVVRHLAPGSPGAKTLFAADPWQAVIRVPLMDDVERVNALAADLRDRQASLEALQDAEGKIDVSVQFDAADSLALGVQVYLLPPKEETERLFGCGIRCFLGSPEDFYGVGVSRIFGATETEHAYSEGCSFWIGHYKGRGKWATLPPAWIFVPTGLEGDLAQVGFRYLRAEPKDLLMGWDDLIVSHSHLEASGAQERYHMITNAFQGGTMRELTSAWQASCAAFGMIRNRLWPYVAPAFVEGVEEGGVSPDRQATAERTPYDIIVAAIDETESPPSSEETRAHIINMFRRQLGAEQIDGMLSSLQQFLAGPPDDSDDT